MVLLVYSEPSSLFGFQKIPPPHSVLYDVRTLKHKVFSPSALINDYSVYDYLLILTKLITVSLVFPVEFLNEQMLAMVAGLYMPI